MTGKEINDKVGAMHLLFQDHEENYVELINHLCEYQELSEHYGQKVLASLRKGLKDYERYLKLENAIMARSIIVQKKEDTLHIKKSNAEGCYQVLFILDDERALRLRPDRKQSHLLYILILLCSQKNGLLADFFLQEDHQMTPVLDAVVKLIKLLYPNLKKEHAVKMAKELASDRFFSDIYQKMKMPLVDCLYKAKISDDLYWYMPYAVNVRKKQLYKMRMPQANIVLPQEFMPILDALPDAADYLKQSDIDMKLFERTNEDIFSWALKAAKQDDTEGLYELGVFFGTGDVVSQDYKKSREYFDKAHQKGNLDATFQLGVYSMFGFGIEEDIHRALKYFEQAAAKGHAEAAAWAGQIYERGTDGITINHKKAFDLYMIAAEQDNEEAIWYVIQGYLLGNGVEADETKALQWFKKADVLGYYKIRVLWALNLYNKGDKESLDKAYPLILDGCNNDMPYAYFMMAQMVVKGYCETDNREEEMKEWLLEGADCGCQECIDVIRKKYPDIYIEYKDDWEETISMLDIFRDMVMSMDHIEQESFIQLVIAYRERWRESYLAEMCKQLSIYKPRKGKGDNWAPERRITVRKSKGGKLPYELVFSLANGEEVIIDKMNANCLVLYLLTIICSYKSGYTTKMAKSDACKPFLRELVLLVFDESIQYADYFIDKFMYFESDSQNKINKDDYKQYSNQTKQAIKAAIGHSDESTFYLFYNRKIANRQNLRCMNLDPQYIDIPKELMNLAAKMPDALDILKLSNNQSDTPILNE
jgi:hypothetical protein